MLKYSLDSDQKALEINLNEKIYGTFAEIGAGQEVARYFFKVGAAAGTIAKTMSAYDKVYSDEIYGTEEKKRYVCESRLVKMLDHEYRLLDDRLSDYRPNTNFFVFANTVSTLNFHRTVTGHGWMGLRFQLSPDSPPNDLILHVRLLDNSTSQQQSAIGILGVNMIYACYNYANDPEKMIKSLMEQIHRRVNIDMVRLSGPDFDVDNRLVSYWMVKHNLSNIALFNEQGHNIHPSEFLYKQYLMLIRGNFRPLTLVGCDLIQKAYDQFRNEEEVEEGKSHLILEILYKADRAYEDEKDFLERVYILNRLGYKILLSNCTYREEVITYLSKYKIKKIGIGLGSRKVEKLISEKYEQFKNDRLLTEFGKLFRNNTTLYVYPSLKKSTGELFQVENLRIPEGAKYIYKHLQEAGYIKGIKVYTPENLSIHSKDVRNDMLKNGKYWTTCVLPEVKDMILANKWLKVGTEEDWKCADEEA